MLIALNYSGHYPTRYVEVSEEEYQKLVDLNKKHRNLCDLPESEDDFINTIVAKSEIKIPTFVIYE
jgi:hypothetical protein